MRKQYDTLIWCSEKNTYPEFASHRDNQPPDDIVCDMWYKGKSIDDYMYFEVKSAKTEFFMSIYEYNSFINNKSNYKIVLADIDTKAISLHSFDELDNKKSIDTYIFRFKQKFKEE